MYNQRRRRPQRRQSTSHPNDGPRTLMWLGLILIGISFFIPVITLLGVLENVQLLDALNDLEILTLFVTIGLFLFAIFQVPTEEDDEGIDVRIIGLIGAGLSIFPILGIVRTKNEINLVSYGFGFYLFVAGVLLFVMGALTVKPPEQWGDYEPEPPRGYQQDYYSQGYGPEYSHRDRYYDEPPERYQRAPINREAERRPVNREAERRPVNTSDKSQTSEQMDFTPQSYYKEDETPAKPSASYNPEGDTTPAKGDIKPEAIFCPICGANNTSGKFCGECGAKLT